MTDTNAWIWFQLVFGIGTRRAELLLSYYESAPQIRGEYARGGRILGMLQPRERAACETAWQQADEIRRQTQAKGCDVITPDHPRYPRLLGEIYSPPAALYVRGDLGCLDGALAVAVVGTRKHTRYGGEAAAHLVAGLVQGGAVIVSGLAPGIDTEAHRAALKAGGKTVGVLGCGIDYDYPSDTWQLKGAVRQSGAVVTEYPLGTPARRDNFPMRNRLISGMSHGTLVVEAGARSGSLVTARLAGEQGREVFAVPAPLFGEEEYLGTNQLIKEGARLADSAQDILACYPHLAKGRPPAAAPPGTVPAQPRPSGDPPAAAQALPGDAGEAARTVYGHLGPEAAGVDHLLARTGLGPGELMSALTELELYGAVRCYPGRRFGLCGQTACPP